MSKLITFEYELLLNGWLRYPRGSTSFLFWKNKNAGGASGFSESIQQGIVMINNNNNIFACINERTTKTAGGRGDFN